MSYVDEHLLPGERVVHRTKLHPVVFLPGSIACLWGLIFLAAGSPGVGTLVLLLALLVLVPVGINYATSEFAVTTTRVIIKSGWLNRKTIELQLGKVEGLSVDQPILGRILDYGTLSVGGTGGTKEQFKQILAPIVFRKQVQQQIERANRPGTPSAVVVDARDEAPGNREERECPQCAERILAKAARCRFCGQQVTPLTSST